MSETFGVRRQTQCDAALDAMGEPIQSAAAVGALQRPCYNLC